MNPLRDDLVKRLREGIDKRVEEDVEFEENNRSNEEPSNEKVVEGYGKLLESNFVKRVFEEGEER